MSVIEVLLNILPAGLWRSIAARRFIAPPEDGNAAEASYGL
jgi:hypothetical protein